MNACLAPKRWCPGTFFEGWVVGSVGITETRRGDLVYDDDKLGEWECVLRYVARRGEEESHGVAVRRASTFGRLETAIAREVPGAIPPPAVPDIGRGSRRAAARFADRLEPFLALRCVVAWCFDVDAFDPFATWTSDDVWISAAIARYDHPDNTCLGAIAEWRRDRDKMLAEFRSRAVAASAALATARAKIAEFATLLLDDDDAPTDIVDVEAIDDLISSVRVAAVGAATADLARRRSLEARGQAAATARSHAARSQRLQNAAKRDTEAERLDTMPDVPKYQISILRAQSSYDLAVANLQSDETACDAADAHAEDLERKANQATATFKAHFDDLALRFPDRIYRLRSDFLTALATYHDNAAASARRALVDDDDVSAGEEEEEEEDI